MDMRKYLKNRIAFPLAELAKHRGEWVAWSPDGAKIVVGTYVHAKKELGVVVVELQGPCGRL